MSPQTDDVGKIQALLEWLVKFQLPRTLEIEQRIDCGECLRSSEIEFLKCGLQDTQCWQRLIARNSEFHELDTRIVQLYVEIVRKAIENEKDA